MFFLVCVGKSTFEKKPSFLHLALSHTHTHTYVYACMHTCMHAHACTHTHTPLSKQIIYGESKIVESSLLSLDKYTPTLAHMHAHVYGCECVSKLEYACTHPHPHTHSSTGSLGAHEGQFSRGSLPVFLQQTLVNISDMGRDVHSLMMSIQHFLCRPLHHPPSKVP